MLALILSYLLEYTRTRAYTTQTIDTATSLYLYTRANLLSPA